MAATQVANVGSTGVIVSANILNGATESEEITTNGMVVWGVYVPSGWTAANLTFKEGHVAGTRKVVTDGVTASTNYTVQTTAIAMRSGTARRGWITRYAQRAIPSIPLPNCTTQAGCVSIHRTSM